MHNKLPTLLPLVLYWLIGIVVFIYLSLRAYYIPITHDEAGTFLEFVVFPLQNTLLAIPPTSTNHILHTLSVKFSTYLFGNEVFFIRLPVLLAYLFYFHFSLQWLLKQTTSPFWIIIGLIFLHFHPYLLEFFSLSRGYGLGIAWMMGSIYYLSIYFENHETRHLFLTVFLAALSVYTNLVFGFYHLSLTILLLAHTLLPTHLLKYQNHRKKTISAIKVVLGVNFMLILIAAIPLYKLITNNAFYHGGTKNFIADTIGSLIRWNLYGQSYFGEFDLPIIAACIAFLLFIAIVLMIRAYFLKQRPKSDKVEEGKTSYPILITLLLGVVCLQNLYIFLFDSKYPVGRMVLFLIPLTMATLFTLFSYLQEKIYAKITAVFLASMLIFHLSQTFNIQRSYEWGFDKDTPKMLSFVQQQAEAEQKILSLGVHWLMRPSADYYTYTMDLSNIEVKGDKILTVNKYDYYYIHEKYAKEHLLYCKIVQRFGDGRILLLYNENNNTQ